MAHIKITKGLMIPIKGNPTGPIVSLPTSNFISLHLHSFEETRFKLLAKENDIVKIGQPLVEDKDCLGRVWTSPAAGHIIEVRRGLKRRLLDIIIQVADKEHEYEYSPFDYQQASKKELIDRLKTAGFFTSIKSRPFGLLANPTKEPRSIFVKAVESAPFIPSAEMQVQGHELDFQLGLDALVKLTNGPVHLVHAKNSSFEAFTQAKNVHRHTIEGPHPAATFSVFIQHLDPIKRVEDVVWTIHAREVVAIGHFLRTAKHLKERIISIAGPGIIPGRTGYFKIRQGTSIESLLTNRVGTDSVRFISGDPLTGRQVQPTDFIGFDDVCFCVIPEPTERELLHFFRLGIDKFSFSRAYLSGHLKKNSKVYDFTTNLHGEHRAFIDPSLYDKVMPLAIPTMQLVKAVMAEDYDLAEELGLLEVVSEDFALPTFVCPSKIEMTEIIKEGLKAHAKEVLG